MSENIDVNELGLVENVIKVNRCAKVVKGGRRFSFAAIVVVGDRNGHVGAGLGKANEVPEAIRKAQEQAKKSIKKVNIHGHTIAHDVLGKYGAGSVLLKPASEGKGVIASGVVRAVVEAAGIQNVLSKCLGSSNPHNAVKATIAALEMLRTEEEINQARQLGDKEAK